MESMEHEISPKRIEILISIIFFIVDLLLNMKQRFIIVENVSLDVNIKVLKSMF
jgi:hypothetical protein